MDTFNGLKVKVSPHCRAPRMTVSPEFARLQSPELVAATNIWMEKFFGWENRIYTIKPGALGLGSEGQIVMSPEHFAMLRLSDQYQP